MKSANDFESIKPAVKESYSKKVRTPFEKLKTKLKKQSKAGITDGLKKMTEKMK
jgi:hypothetical protein